MTEPSRLSLRGIAAGIHVGWPMGPSGFIYGLAFGTLAAGTGLSLAESMLMSAAVFSGTAQIAVVSVWSTLGGLLPAMLIIFVANVRYALMGASLRPWFGDMPAHHAAPPLAFLVDGAYAIGMRAYGQGHRDAGYLLGPALVSFAGWVVGTGLGHAFGRIAGDPRALALDFVVVAFCAAAAVAMARVVRDAWPYVAAGVAVVAVDRLGLGAWAVVVAGLVAAVVAAMRYRTPEAPS